MSDNIVISFSNKDRAFVQELTELLDQRLSRYRTVRGDEAGDGRPRVWIYPQQTDGSRHIIEIHRQLAQALAVIVVLSEHSAASRWVLEEVQVAWNANKLIIPITVGERTVIKQSDVGTLLSTRTWIYAEGLDIAAVADSIVTTLVELEKITRADIGSRYRHKRQLTTRPTGGYFEATRDDDERLFVVKEVASSDREVLLELDAKEAKLRQLRNPALPLIEDYIKEEGRRYIVWEEVPGRHLGDVLAAQKDQPLAWTDIQPWVADALTTLALLHQAKVLHLGLKPQNFKRTRDGQIKLLDIGLDRRPMGSAATGTTDPYLAPELLDERDPSPRSDLYAAGAVLYTLLTGDRQPSPTKPPVVKRNREVPEHVSQAIAKAMSADPAQRFRSANEFLVALEGAQEPVVGAARLPRWLVLAGVGLVVVVALFALLPLLTRGPGPDVAASTTGVVATAAPVAAGASDAAPSETVVSVAPSNAQATSLPVSSVECPIYRLGGTGVTWDMDVNVPAGEIAFIDAWGFDTTTNGVFVTITGPYTGKHTITDGAFCGGISANTNYYPIWSQRFNNMKDPFQQILLPAVPVSSLPPLPSSFQAVMAMVRDEEVNRQAIDPQRGVIIETPTNVITTIEANNSHGFTRLESTVRDFVLHADITWGEPEDSCQLSFRQNDTGFYTTGIRNEGAAYAGLAEASGRWIPFADTKSSTILTAPSAQNSLVLVGISNRLQLFINGVQVLSFSDPSNSVRNFALSGFDNIGSNETARSSCGFTNVWLWAPDGPAATVGQRPPLDTAISLEDQAFAEAILQRAAMMPLLFTEDFEGPGSRFWIGEYERGSSVIENGQFKIEALTEYPLQAHAVSELGRRKLRGDFSIATDVIHKRDAVNAGGGIVFGGAGDDEASWQTSEVLIYGDGTWAVRTYRNQAFDQQFSLERTQHSAIFRDDKANRLQITRSSETVVITINGTVVGIVTGSPVVEGWFGLTVVRADENPTATVFFDNVDVREAQ